MWRRGSLRGLGSRRAASHRYRRKTSPQPTRPRRRRYPISRQSGGHHVWGGGQSPPRGISYSRLIHDDVVGSDEIRRGEKTFAHSLTSAANSAHLGQSLAVLAGDLAIAEVIDLLNDPDVSPQLRAPATRIVINAITESAHGEIADVAFRTTESPPHYRRRSRGHASRRLADLHLGQLHRRRRCVRHLGVGVRKRITTGP